MMLTKQALVAAGAILLCGAVLGSARCQSGSSPAAPKKAEEQFKNIQVLKGIPADQLISTMQFVSTSLGVECEFCHVQGAFEKDDKKTKQTARKMMEMMITINQENFDGHREVTCYSCHRGSAIPVGMPPVMAEGSLPATGKNAESEAEGAKTAVVGGPSADDLLAKYLQAAGGSAAIEKITSRVMKGEITFGDRNVPIDIYAKDPEKRISFTQRPTATASPLSTGRKAGWARPAVRCARCTGPILTQPPWMPTCIFPFT